MHTEQRTIGNTPKKRDWLTDAMLLLFLFVYFSSFWGQAAQLFPAPVHEWAAIFTRTVPGWWEHYFATLLSGGDSRVLYSTLVAFLLGLALPLVGLKISGWSLADVGLTAPRFYAKGAFCVSVVIAIVAGFWLSSATANPWGSPLYEILEMVSMIPEHFFFFSIVMLVTLPERRLRVPSGIAQSNAVGVDPRQRSGPSWQFVRLTERETIAVVIAAAFFQLAHAGTQPLEVVLSLPFGLMFAYLTLCTGSIWPALVVHWLLNLAPLTWLLLANPLGIA